MIVEGLIPVTETYLFFIMPIYRLTIESLNELQEKTQFRS